MYLCHKYGLRLIWSSDDRQSASSRSSSPRVFLSDTFLSLPAEVCDVRANISPASGFRNCFRHRSYGLDNHRHDYRYTDYLGLRCHQICCSTGSRFRTRRWFRCRCNGMFIGIFRNDPTLTWSKGLAIVQASIVLCATSYGLGRTVEHVEANSLVSLQKVSLY